MHWLKQNRWQRFWLQPHYLKQHTQLLSLSCLTIALLVMANVILGSLKPTNDIDWVDVIGESSTALFFALTLTIVCYLRPNNRITRLLVIGLLFICAAHTQDALDEWFAIQGNDLWTSLIESLPVGWLLLVVGLWQWLSVHWRTVRLLKGYQLEPESAQDSVLGLNSWQTVINQSQPAQSLTLVNFDQPVKTWMVLWIKSVLTPNDVVTSSGDQQLIILHDQALANDMAVFANVLAPCNVNIRHATKPIGQSPDEVLWVLNAELA